ncbi:MAG: FadR/GntR family transcriptional regulator [Oscillospiraceae bacterium]
MIKPITKTSMYKEIVGQIIIQIKNGVWKPNEQLPSEAELAKSFGVSRNSIREALKSLALFGIVYARPGQGTFITQDALQRVGNTELLDAISEEASLPELMETRLIIEPQLSKLAALRATDEDKKMLVMALDLLKNDLYSRLDILNAVQNNKMIASIISTLKNDQSNVGSTQTISNPSDNGIRFHMCIVEIANNNVLGKFLESIKGELEKQRSRIILRNTEDVQLMLQDHVEICEAILVNDPRRAASAMHEHLLHSYKSMANYDHSSVNSMFLDIN